MSMNTKMATVFIFNVVGIALLFGGIKGTADDSSTKGEPKERQPFSIEHIENGPEVLVNVPGIEKPLCFDIETMEEIVRVIQDPQTGIVVNTQIFYDIVNNKTYIGAILVSKEGICLMATQYHVLVNNVRFNWGETRALSINGNRVIISDDMVVVAFGQCRISLVIQRHHPARENVVDYNEFGKDFFNTPAASNESEIDDRVVTETKNPPAMLPIYGYAESESFIQQFLSSKRRRGLLLQKFFGINQDGAVVGNGIIAVDSEELRKRNNDVKDSNSAPNDGHHLDQGEVHEHGQRHPPTQHDKWKEPLLNKQQSQEHPNDHRRRRHSSERHKHHRNWKSRMERESEKKRDSSIYLDMYIADSRDFSNKTHGLLGQFLVKNVTREKIRYKDGKMKARLLVQENPSHRTNALYTSRNYTAKNAVRDCWKIRQYGRDVLDGKYSDYVVPNIWYVKLKELPPPAPL